MATAGAISPTDIFVIMPSPIQRAALTIFFAVCSLYHFSTQYIAPTVKHSMRGSLFIPPDIRTRYGYIQHIPNGIVRALPLRSKSLNIL